MQRNKKSDNSQSTTKILKPKYLDNKKPTSSTSNKIMLTDLCPQEKAKIGQLIKTLQQRKKQNQDLQQQLNSWKSNYITLEKVKIQLQNIIELKKTQNLKLSQQITKLNQQKFNKDLELQEKNIQLQKYFKKYQQKVNYAINTNHIQILNQQTQTKEKKKKFKEKEIQVNTIEKLGGVQQKQTRKNYFYQPNSKSFDKIMKGDRLISDNKKYQTTAFREQDHFDEEKVFLRQMKPQNGEEILKRTEQIQQLENQNDKKLRASQLEVEVNISNNNWSEYEDYSQTADLKFPQEQIRVEDTQNDDDEFQMLAKKWLQLKQKNIQQLTQGYFINQNENQSNTNLKSLGIQSKLKNNTHQPKPQNDESEQIFDDEELNKALKSKNFNASRLLSNSRSKRNISENSEKKSRQNNCSGYRNAEYQSKGDHDNKKPNFNQFSNNKKSSLVSPNPQKQKPFLELNPKGADFYSAELLDLVQQINK